MTDTDLLICVKRVDLLRRFALSGCFLVVGDKPAIPHASSARQVASSGFVSRQSLQQPARATSARSLGGSANLFLEP